MTLGEIHSIAFFRLGMETIVRKEEKRKIKIKKNGCMQTFRSISQKLCNYFVYISYRINRLSSSRLSFIIQVYIVFPSVQVVWVLAEESFQLIEIFIYFFHYSGRYSMLNHRFGGDDQDVWWALERQVKLRYSKRPFNITMNLFRTTMITTTLKTAKSNSGSNMANIFEIKL